MPHPEKLTVGWVESWDKLLAQNLPFRIFLKGRDLTYLDCNESYAANHGLKPGEIIGCSDYDLYPQELAEKYRAEDLRILETGISETIEVRFVKDGQEHHGQTIKSPFRDQSGEVIGILGTFWDVSELKRTEEALQKSAQLLSDTGEMAQVGGWELDLLTNEVSWTEEVSRIHGVESGYRPKLEEALNFYAPESRPALEEALKKAAETGEPYDLESLFIPSGHKERIWVRSLGRTVNSDGKITKLAGTFQNIDKYKRAEEKLRESEARFRRMFDQSPIGAAMVSLDNRFLVVNEALCRITGYSAEELTARSFVDITHPDDIAADVAQARQLEAGEIDCFDMDKRYLRSDGSVVWIHLNVRMIRDENGRAVYFLPTVEDITARKRAEHALQKSEEKYRTLVENANEAIVVIQDGALKFANSKASKLFGYSLEEAVGKPFVEFIHPDNRLLAAERYRKRLDGEVATLVHPFRTIHKDGSVRWAEINSVLISWEDKPAIMSYLSDITERKQAEEALQNERSLLRTLIDNIPDSIYSKDLACRKTLANLTEVRYLGAKSESEVLGKDDFEFYPKEIAEGFFADDQSVMQSGQPVLNKEELVINENGQKRWLLTSKLPLKDESGNITGIVGIGRDITNRKRAEDALRESEHRLADIIDFLPDATFAVNKKGEVIAWNHSMEELTGALKEELIGKGDFAYAAPFYGETGPMLIDLIFRDWEEMKENYDYLIRREDQVVAEAFVPALRGGKGAYLWGIAAPLYDSSEAIVGAIESLRDITEHKQAEVELRTAEANYRNLFERVPSGLYRSTPEGRFLEVNPAMADLFGYSSVQEMMTLDIGSAFYHSAEERGQWVEKLLQAGELRNTENHSLRKDGSSMVLLENSRVVRDESGKVLFFEGTLTDITDRKRAEEALQKSEEKYRLLIENSHDIIYTLTPDGVFTFVSPGWTVLLGHPPDQVVGRPFQQFVHPDDLEMCQVSLQKTIETGQRQTGIEYRVQHADGSWRWHTSNGVPLKDEAGKVASFEGIARDITDRKRLEGEMDKTRADFLFGVSHELKTPLFLMAISLEMLENSPESGRAKRTREFMETWKRNLHRLRHLVFNMVDSQRTQTMGFKIERQSTDFRALIERVVQEQELLAGPKKVRITMDLAPIPPMFIDPEAIYRLVENLLTNAIKFSPRGGEVAIHLKEEDAQAVLTVKDQGSGISAEEQKGLFLPFQRAATAVRSVIPGTGLGLYVAMIIVDAHGGTISLRSKVGKGTTVTARLPLGEPGK